MSEQFSTELSFQNRARTEENFSIVGSRDARARILSALILIVTVVSITSLTALSLCAMAAIVFALVCGLSPAELQHRLFHVEGFLIALFLLLPFTVPGEAIFAIGPLTATSNGVSKAIEIALKVVTTATVVFSLLGTLEPVRAGRALAALGIPAKIVHLLLFTIRYAAVLKMEAMRLRDAMRARGFQAGTNLHSFQTLGNLIGMILVRSIERAERVDEAMRCRAFSGQFPLRPPKPFQIHDYLLIAYSGFAAALMLVCSLAL